MSEEILKDIEDYDLFKIEVNKKTNSELIDTIQDIDKVVDDMKLEYDWEEAKSYKECLDDIKLNFEGYKIISYLDALISRLGREYSDLDKLSQKEIDEKENNFWHKTYSILKNNLPEGIDISNDKYEITISSKDKTIIIKRDHRLFIDYLTPKSEWKYVKLNMFNEVIFDGQKKEDKYNINFEKRDDRFFKLVDKDEIFNKFIILILKEFNISNVGILKVKDLFKLNLKIPVYQRPYLWKIEQVENLLKDFYEIFKDREKNIKTYLIGNMIFHKKLDDCELNIVDGQQRIITLFLLLYNLGDHNIKESIKKLEIRNPLSQKAIYDNNQIIKNFISRNLSDQISEFKEFINSNILISFITTHNQDEAFVFFDSQNTRGKALNREDLLKAHHLRDSVISQEKRMLYAKLWENYDEFELKKLLEINLTYNRNLVKGNYKYDIDVYEEFKSNNFKKALNNYNQPPIFKNIEYDIKTNKTKLILKNEVEFKIGNGLILENSQRFLPFEILQSISGGEEFFWYISKYMLLKKDYGEKINIEITDIVDSLSIFLQDYFYAITFLYYDKYFA